MIWPTDVRDLRGVLTREEFAKLAGFLSLKKPTTTMQEEPAKAGCCTYEGVQYDRIQFLTVQDILEGEKAVSYPHQNYRCSEKDSWFWTANIPEILGF